MYVVTAQLKVYGGDVETHNFYAAQTPGKTFDADLSPPNIE
jgi:hypothetical protein